jgi:hypothetical protein
VGLGKTIAIGVLAVALLIAIACQFGRRKEPKAQPDAEQTASKNLAAPTSSATAAPAATPRAENPWPTFNVAEVVASNPFMLPEVLRPRREATQTLTPSAEPGEAEEDIAAIESAGVRELRRRQAEFMASLRATGVDMILRSRRGSVARIGELSLRVGDVHEGLRVEAIGQNGVVFAPAVQSDGQPE